MKAVLGSGYWDVLKIILNVYLFSFQLLPTLNCLLASLGLTLDETHFAIHCLCSRSVIGEKMVVMG